jgi:hypothetical protein
MRPLRIPGLETGSARPSFLLQAITKGELDACQDHIGWGALTLLLTGGALAYAGHSNSQQGAQIGQQFA